jgi:hypothetical protein
LFQRLIFLAGVYFVGFWLYCALEQQLGRDYQLLDYLALSRLRCGKKLTAL